MTKFKWFFVVVLVVLWSSLCFEAGANVANFYSRALKSDGTNWGPLKIDSSGNLLVAAQ